MKAFMSRWGIARWVVFPLLFVVCCSDPEADEITPPPQEEEEEEITPLDADAALKSFSFASSLKITGSAPTVTNTSLVRTDNGDTIYVLPGIKNLIRVSHPESRPIKGVYFAASGSTFYYDAPIQEEEESDTVSIIIFEVNPDDLEKPVNVPVEITPYDNSNQPIDVIERIITVEDPSDNGCSILQDGDTSNIDNIYGWHWRWTVTLDMNDQPVAINAPGRNHINNFKYQGCCKNTACPALVFEEGVQKWIYDKEFDVSTYYSIVYEWFEFYTNGTFFRQTIELSSGISNANDSTDWCTEEPVISDYTDEVLYFGTHDYVPGNTGVSYGTTHSICDDPLGLCGYGSRGGELTASCHAMIITVNLEGQKNMRMYTRQYGNPLIITDENGIERTVWRD
jgi:hypothetical protein